MLSIYIFSDSILHYLRCLTLIFALESTRFGAYEEIFLLTTATAETFSRG